MPNKDSEKLSVNTELENLQSNQIKHKVIIRTPILNLENLKMHNNGPTHEQVSQFKTRLSLLEKSIPEYTGGTKELSYFVVDFVQKLAVNDALLQSATFTAIESKIKDEPRNLIVNYKPTKWDELKALLQQRYVDPKSKTLTASTLTSTSKI